MRPPFAMRRYCPEDRDACLAIFDGHVPEVFQASERTAFADYLDDLPGPYWVVTGDDGATVACGGVAVEPDPMRGSLCWGMVHRDHQRRGIGTVFALARTLHLATSGCRTVRLCTDRATVPFFRRVGFVETDRRPDRLIELALSLNGPTEQRIRQRIIEQAILKPIP